MSIICSIRFPFQETELAIIVTLTHQYHYLFQGCLIPIINAIFIKTNYSQLSSCSALFPTSYPMTSVSNGSGPSLQVWVQEGTDLLSNWQSRWWITSNRHFTYSLIEVFQPIWFGQVVSGLSSRSICRFRHCSCFCCLIMISYQNCLFNIQ